MSSPTTLKSCQPLKSGTISMVFWFSVMLSSWVGHGPAVRAAYRGHNKKHPQLARRSRNGGIVRMNASSSGHDMENRLANDASRRELWDGHVNTELHRLSMEVKPSSFRETQGNLHLDALISKIQENTKYAGKIHRFVKVGSLKKKTAIFMKMDYDCLFMVDASVDIEDFLLDITHILGSGAIDKSRGERIGTGRVTDLRDTWRTVQFNVDGFHFDFVVTHHFSHDVSEQINALLSSASHRERSGLSEAQALFWAKQSSYTHELARLLKLWVRTVFVPGFHNGRSCTMELLACLASEQIEKSADGKGSRSTGAGYGGGGSVVTPAVSNGRMGTTLLSSSASTQTATRQQPSSVTNIHLNGFRRALMLIRDFRKIRKGWSMFYDSEKAILEYYDKEQGGNSSNKEMHPVLLDPADPSNNMFEGDRMAYFDRLGEFAWVTLSRLESPTSKEEWLRRQSPKDGCEACIIEFNRKYVIRDVFAAQPPVISLLPVLPGVVRPKDARIPLEQVYSRYDPFCGNSFWVFNQGLWGKPQDYCLANGTVEIVSKKVHDQNKPLLPSKTQRMLVTVANAEKELASERNGTFVSEIQIKNLESVDRQYHESLTFWAENLAIQYWFENEPFQNGKIGTKMGIPADHSEDEAVTEQEDSGWRVAAAQRHVIPGCGTFYKGSNVDPKYMSSELPIISIILPGIASSTLTETLVCEVNFTLDIKKGPKNLKYSGEIRQLGEKNNASSSSFTRK